MAVAVRLRTRGLLLVAGDDAGVGLTGALLFLGLGARGVFRLAARGIGSLGATTVVLPGWRASLDASGNVRLERDDAR